MSADHSTAAGEIREVAVVGLGTMGPARVLGVLTAMHASSGDPAFAPAPLLAEHAAAGTPFRS
jgi:3-hydroxybutyryl-CoA dehydrogenase